MSIYATGAFWQGLGERAIKTAAQSLIAVLAVDVAGILDVDWIGALSAAGLATLLSALTSLSQPDFTAGPVSVDKGDPAPDPRHHVAV